MPLIGTLTTGVSAMRSFTKDLEVIGNNIANVNTVGFKGSHTTFQDSFSNAYGGNNKQVGTGVSIASITGTFTQGSLSTTGVTSDLGISGEGFFHVVNPGDGQQYVTRAGNFRVDNDGYLVTTQGYQVQGLTGGTIASPITDSSTVGPIKIGTDDGGTPPSVLQSYSIDRLGNLTEYYANGTSAVTNRVLLQNFTNPNALQKSGDNLFTNFAGAGPIGAFSGADNSPGKNGVGAIESGTLELANVDLTEEFANMITTQRSFQAASRLVTVSDSVLEDIVNLKRS